MLKRAVRGIVMKMFRVRIRGSAAEPTAGWPTIVVANHVSYLDGVLLACVSRRPMLFAVTA